MEKDTGEEKIHHMKCDMNQGHMGGSDRFKSWKEKAEVFCWMLKIWKIDRK